MTLAKDYFDKEEDFRLLCGDAQSQARGEASQEFAAEMVVKSKALGLRTPLSAKQLAWLCKLADWIEPRRITKE